jgi:hypothetical protein
MPGRDEGWHGLLPLNIATPDVHSSIGPWYRSTAGRDLFPLMVVAGGRYCAMAAVRRSVMAARGSGGVGASGGTVVVQRGSPAHTAAAG